MCMCLCVCVYVCKEREKERERERKRERQREKQTDRQTDRAALNFTDYEFVYFHVNKLMSIILTCILPQYCNMPSHASHLSCV